MRRKIEVDKKLLQSVVEKVEECGPCPGGVTALYKEVAELYNSSGPPEKITGPVVSLRIQEWKIPIKTVPVRKVRKKADRKLESDSWAKILKETPLKHKGIVKKAAKGSHVAMIKLKCLDCSNWQPREVRECTVQGCPLWPRRPFRGQS